MDDKMLVDLTRETVAKVDDILRSDTTAFIKEYGCEQNRVDKLKIEKASTMIGTLRFFLDKVTSYDDRIPLNG